MFTQKKLFEYLQEYNVTWAKDLPQDAPPQDVLIAENGESLFRLTKEKNVITEDDLKTFYELRRDKINKDSWWQASGLSTLLTLEDARSMQKLPSLKKNKGIAEIKMYPRYGVVLNTPSSHCVNHYTWWQTTSFELDDVDIHYHS